MSGPEPQIKLIRAENVTVDNFKPYGQLQQAQVDGKEFNDEDAALQLDRGTPRFYIMRLPQRGLSFSTITRHKQVTQCLGAINGEPWYMAVAPPDLSSSRPDVERLKVFRIPGDAFIKMEIGTWHAGPLFDQPHPVSFYNLELSDTNLVDHETYDFSRSDGVTYLIEKEA
ncbi:unnamed protein product [Vitrella brassicaformis CCMP3155]|uniref:Ureidoglycolate hydrolase n=2 Tax=Vitrella brassicaformis TaxID=1169539 RepID=A0A0G4EL00_VITBC|nr:unnamed protein product [Vitrella brassicaformis CCMP3155]|eukprot:CEL97856.1 unnamed protein product [Vitrella brassicaformis CCMP3155]